MQETWVQSLGLEDLLEKGVTTHFSILAWRIPWTDDEVAESDTTEQLIFSTFYYTELMKNPSV